MYWGDEANSIPHNVGRFILHLLHSTECTDSTWTLEPQEQDSISSSKAKVPRPTGCSKYSAFLSKCRIMIFRGSRIARNRNRASFAER